MKTDEVSLLEICNEVNEELAERIEEKSIEVNQKWESDFIFGPCNRSLIHTLIFNVASNSIKYSKGGGKLSFKGRLESDHFHLSIADTGVGIPGEHLPFIFDRFKRFRPEDGLSYGLGLPIVKSIATFHKIDLKVESEPDQGTQFHIYFPLHAD